jgi:EAL domain-containing protein (putative c-di-GMP-specific phosphodiesterase class I)
LQFCQPDFSDKVAAIVLGSGLAPELIELELTESLIMKNIEDSRKQMSALKRLGVRISIDDFGTGHSSLSYLYQLPIDTLKIDRSFIEHITEPSGTATIVQAIIELARKLALQVIGEGVETTAQLAALKVAGCELVQGFLFSKPVPASRAGESLATAWRKRKHPGGRPPDNAPANLDAPSLAPAQRPSPPAEVGSTPAFAGDPDAIAE